MRRIVTIFLAIMLFSILLLWPVRGFDYKTEKEMKKVLNWATKQGGAKWPKDYGEMGKILNWATKQVKNPEIICQKYPRRYCTFFTQRNKTYVYFENWLPIETECGLPIDSELTDAKGRIFIFDNVKKKFLQELYVTGGPFTQRHIKGFSGEDCGLPFVNVYKYIPKTTKGEKIIKKILQQIPCLENLVADFFKHITEKDMQLLAKSDYFEYLQYQEENEEYNPNQFFKDFLRYYKMPYSISVNEFFEIEKILFWNRGGSYVNIKLKTCTIEDIKSIICESGE